MRGFKAIGVVIIAASAGFALALLFLPTQAQEIIVDPTPTPTPTDLVSPPPPDPTPAPVLDTISPVLNFANEQEAVDYGKTMPDSDKLDLILNKVINYGILCAGK